MNPVKNIILLCISWLFFYSALAQVHPIPGFMVQAYGAADGLSSSEVICIYQDAKDFIWIGTKDGVSRFDGKTFKNFETLNSKRIGAVYQVCEDKNKTLWLATETGLYHWQGENFMEYIIPGAASCFPFYAIHFTPKGEAWIGTLKGPLHIPEPRKKMLQPADEIFLKGWETVAAGDISVKYISSSGGMIAFGADLFVYLLQGNQLKKLPNPRQSEDFIHGVQVKEDTVYWNNLFSGLHYWTKNETKNAIQQKAYFFDLISFRKELFYYSNFGVYSVKDKDRRIIDLEGLNIRTPTKMLIDKENNFWMGATEGVFKVTKNPFTVHWQSLLYSDEIYSLLRRRNGELLLGANRGTIFIVKDSFQYYQNGLNVVPLAEVFSMHEDKRGWLWFATGYQGISLYRNGRLRNFNRSNGLADNTHHSFYQAKNGDLWTAGDRGLTKMSYHQENDSFSFRSFQYNVPVTYHKLFSIVEAPRGELWAAGQLGLFRFSKDSLQPYSLPQLNEKISITEMKKDPSGKVWITTRGHGIMICEFDRDGILQLVKQFLENDGLYSRTFLSVDFDAGGNAWAGNYSGITAIELLNDARYRIRNFDVSDGFIGKNFQNLRMFSDGTERMWACTSSGAVSFYPRELLQTSRSASLHITSIDLLNSLEAPENFLDKESNDTRYEFPHYINSFSIHFAALHYSNPGAVRYFYRLQDADSLWISTGTEGSVNFRQLPPGQYTLQVKANIGGSDWTDTSTLHFNIALPWWKTWWFITASLVMAGGVVLLYIKSRESILRAKEKEKTEMEKLRSMSYRHQLEIEQIINYFTVSLSGHNTVDGVLWDVARNCISRLGFEDCVIYLIDENSKMLVQKAAWGPKTTEEDHILNPLEIPLGQGIVGTVAVNGKAEKIDDTSLDPRYIEDDVRRYSEITVPIFEEGKVIGVIDSEHHNKNFYTDRHMQILATIASHCGARIGRIKADAREEAARMESLLNRQKALEASLQSMRLQMNPHFLFNALNSIQQMILSGEEMTATRFLSKFSKLLRLVLMSSDREELSLKEELEILHLYVELESLRFKESFTYEISLGKEVEPEEINVPGLLFQPFVENAIWHGLMHKDGEKKLFIRFDEKEEGLLFCTIEDNGVGREMSAKEKLKAGKGRHAGKGTKLGLERLIALNEKHGTKNKLDIIDLKDHQNHPMGTRVEISLYHNGI